MGMVGTRFDRVRDLSKKLGRSMNRGRGRTGSLPELWSDYFLKQHDRPYAATRG